MALVGSFAFGQGAMVVTKSVTLTVFCHLHQHIYDNQTVLQQTTDGPSEGSPCIDRSVENLRFSNGPTVQEL